METFSALLAICAGNSPVPGEFPTQRPVTRSFDVYFDLRPNKRLSKQPRGWWFETQSCPLWCHRNVICGSICASIIGDVRRPWILFLMPPYNWVNGRHVTTVVNIKTFINVLILTTVVACCISYTYDMQHAFAYMVPLKNNRSRFT